MVLRCLARAALIAVGDGLDDLAVLIERRLKAARIRHRQRAETGELVAQVRDDADEAVVARRMIEQIVELDVRLDDLLHRRFVVVALLVLLDVAADDDEQALQVLELIFCDMLCSQAVQIGRASCRERV